MENNIRFVGLDVHAEMIAAAVVDPGSLVKSLATIVHCRESVRKLMRRLGHPDQLRVCYEAGPTGYGLYWILTGMGIHCDVVAPTLIPTKSGDRVKTDRRDGEKLAKYYQHGELTPVWVPEARSQQPRSRTKEHNRTHHSLDGRPAAHQSPLWMTFAVARRGSTCTRSVSEHTRFGICL